MDRRLWIEGGFTAPLQLQLRKGAGTNLARKGKTREGYVGRRNWYVLPVWEARVCFRRRRERAGEIWPVRRPGRSGHLPQRQARSRAGDVVRIDISAWCCAPVSMYHLPLCESCACRGHVWSGRSQLWYTGKCGAQWKGLLTAATLEWGSSVARSCYLREARI